MLIEKVPYKNNLPIYACFSNVSCEDYHMHYEMEIMLVLRGHISCTIHHLEYDLKMGDLLLIEPEDLHRLHDSSHDLLMLTIYVDLEQFTYKYPNVDYMIFICEDYSKDSDEKYEDMQAKTAVLKSQMAKIMLAFEENKNATNLLMDYVDEFVSILVSQFQAFFIEDMKYKTNLDKSAGINFERLYRIIKYIYMNYEKNITLKDIANLEHLSHYYLSHLIKNSSGLSFHNLLNYVRVEQSELKLIDTDLTLTQISEFCGFSSPAYYNKCFKVWHGVTPSTYRKNIRRYERTYCDPFSEEDAFNLLSEKTDIKNYAEEKKDRLTQIGKTALLHKDINKLLEQLNEEGSKQAYTYLKYLLEQDDFRFR